MSMQTISASNFALPRRLAPTLANSFAMIGAPKQVAVTSPIVSVTTFYSFPNLCEIITKLDSRFGRNLGVAIELPVHCSPQWHRLSRTADRGGQLTIVVPPQSRITLPVLKSESETLQIAGWSEVKLCVTVDQAVQRLLSSHADVDRCFMLRPEWHDPTDVFAAIGRHITS